MDVQEIHFLQIFQLCVRILAILAHDHMESNLTLWRRHLGDLACILCLRHLGDLAYMLLHHHPLQPVATWICTLHLER